MNDGASAQGADLVPLKTERKVIQRLQNGDKAAFAELYAWYGDLLYRQAILPRLPIIELAEDCLRDTFRTALEKIETFKVQDRSIFFWLRRIAVNKAIDTHRKYKRDKKIREKAAQDIEQQPQGSQSPDHGLELEDIRKMVTKSLSTLNERYAEALRLRFIEDKDREACAAEMGVTVGNFDVILHRAAKAFRKVYPP